MKRCTRWWQAFKTRKKFNILFLAGILLCLAKPVFSQNYPDFRKVCADGLGNNITLFWSPLNDTCGSFTSLRIYGRVDALSPFQLIDSITNISQTSYVHINAKTISTNWGYFLVYRNKCNGDTSTSVIQDIDFTQPPVSVIDSVSVDTGTGKVVIGWSPNPAPDLRAYVIWSNQGANNIPIDTIVPTNFTDTFGTSPGTGVQSYTLTALDSCFNQSIISTFHRTVLLSHTYDTCGKQLNLSWTRYVGWSNILSYQVYARVNSGSFLLIATNNSAQQTSSFSGFNHGDTVEFFIKALEGTNGFSSTSNRIKIITRKRKFSGRSYISYATVLDSATVEIKVLADSTSDTKVFSLFRKKDDEAFIKVADVNYDGASPTVIIADAGLETYKFSYTYHIISKDRCNKELDTTNIARTILLIAETTTAGNELTWNRYNVWNAGVLQYNLYRGFDFGSGFTWNLISTISNTDSTYIDSNLPLDVGIAGTCYYVEAEENIGNVFGEQSKSRSVTICFVEDALVYFPTAFAPEEINRIFLPKGTNIDYKRTTMHVYASNGQLMKNISDLRLGWDGTNLYNVACPDGVYIYLCELFGLNGKKYNFKGVIHLLR